MAKDIKKILSELLNSKAELEIVNQPKLEQDAITPPGGGGLDTQDPCDEVARECDRECSDDFGTDSQIAEEKRRCMEAVPNPFEDSMTLPTHEDFCVFIEDMCECTRQFKRAKCDKWICKTACRTSSGCEGLPGDPPCGGDCENCDGDSVYCSRVGDCYDQPDHRSWCRNYQLIVERALKEAEKSLGDEFDNCVEAAGGTPVTPENRVAICNCRRNYVRRLDQIQRRKCQILRDARCPRDTDRDVERAYASCMKRCCTGSSSWQSRCPGLNPTSDCNPKPRPSKWNGTRTACEGTNPGGGGGPGGGGNPRPGRPPRGGRPSRDTSGLQVKGSSDRLAAALSKAVKKDDPKPGGDPPKPAVSKKCRCVLDMDSTTPDQDAFFTNCYNHPNGTAQATYDDAACKSEKCDGKECSATYKCMPTGAPMPGRIKGKCKKI